MKIFKLLQYVALFLLLISCQNSNEKLSSLKNKIEQIVSKKKALVGVSIIGNDGRDTISINGNHHFPLQSVFKLHIALTLLSEIDKGRFSLQQKVEVKESDLLPDFWSPLRDDNPKGGYFTIATLIQYAVSQSDNVACDFLIKLIGSPKNVDAYFKKININDMAIEFNEQDMQAKWENMFQNWTTPNAASKVLTQFYENKNKLLSKQSHSFIWKTMKETSTGENRLKGLLPKGTIVAHKTGTSGTNDQGLMPATNDIGIVFLPNGQYFIISVFVTNSYESEESNAKIIAEIAKAAYDYYYLEAQSQ